MKLTAMKLTLPLYFLSAAAALAGFTYETPTEFSSQDDVNGDGRPDILVMDRDTGVLRVLGSIAGVSFTSSGHVATGLERPDSFSSVKLPNGMALTAVGDSLDNRVLIVNPLTATTREVSLGGLLRPSTIVISSPIAGQIPSPIGNLFISSDSNDAPTARRFSTFPILSGVTTLGTSGSNFSATPPPGSLRRGNPVRIQTLNALGFTFTEAATSGFVLAVGVPHPRSSLINLAGLPPDPLWAFGNYGSTAGRAGFLFYTRGASSFLPAEIAANLNPAAFTTAATVDLGSSIHLLITVTTSPTDRLLALLDGGKRAALYDYKVGATPALVRAWSAPAGETFTQGATLEDGSFLLLHGIGGRSTGWKRFDQIGSDVRETLAGDFSSQAVRRQGATVFYFDQEPFVSQSARLVQTSRPGDWTDIGPNGTPVALTDAGVVQGLGTPVPVMFPPPLVVAVTGQFTRIATAGQAPISLATLSGRTGPVVPGLTFSPPAGSYPPLLTSIPPVSPTGTIPGRERFFVSISSMTSDSIGYRISSQDAWKIYTGPIPLTESCLLEAKIFVNNRIFTARYDFANSATQLSPLQVPALPDANQNGLPDSWEAAFAQSSPSADTDGDGQTALQEFLAGTDPRDRFSVTPPALAIPTAEFPLALTITRQTVAGGSPYARVAWSKKLTDARLESSDDLRTWRPVTTLIAIEASEIVHRASLAPAGLSSGMLPAKQFYRLAAVTPRP